MIDAWYQYLETFFLFVSQKKKLYPLMYLLRIIKIVMQSFSPHLLRFLSCSQITMLLKFPRNETNMDHPFLSFSLGAQASCFRCFQGQNGYLLGFRVQMVISRLITATSLVWIKVISSALVSSRCLFLIRLWRFLVLGSRHSLFYPSLSKLSAIF
jgi:hypothetical protein